MAIRFCKGKEKELLDAPKVALSVSLFSDIHATFIQTQCEYVCVCNEKQEYLFCAYDDKNFNAINMHIWNLMSADIDPSCFEKYRQVTLVSCNEISYYLYFFFKKNQCSVFLKGEWWEYLLPYADIVAQERGFSVYSEGNPGLCLADLGYWKTTIPYDEYRFVEDLYTQLKTTGQLYKKKWLNKREANLHIFQRIVSREPFMVARLGNTESMIVQENIFSAPSQLWTKWLYTVAGFFSKENYSTSDVKQYAEMTINAIQTCDIHCCRFDNEIGALNAYANDSSQFIDWYDLYTDLDSSACWLSALKGKKVLIISSACDTIAHQYKKKECLFNDPDILPNMNIIYYQAIETQMGDKKGFENWFHAYRKMVNDISDIDFDIALIAAGAYGYPLAAQIKAWGKQAIELCSGIYPIFGIKVKTQLIIRAVSSMYNKHWIFPIEAPPSNYMRIEKGSYWE